MPGRSGRAGASRPPLRPRFAPSPNRSGVPRRPIPTSRAQSRRRARRRARGASSDGHAAWRPSDPLSIGHGSAAAGAPLHGPRCGDSLEDRLHCCDPGLEGADGSSIGDQAVSEHADGHRLDVVGKRIVPFRRSPRTACGSQEADCRWWVGAEADEQVGAARPHDGDRITATATAAGTSATAAWTAARPLGVHTGESEESSGWAP